MAALCTWTRFHFDKLGWTRLSTVVWNGSSLEVAAPERDETVIEELGFAMADTPAITDRNLEATTNISLKREPACFAFLSPRSVSPPMPIDSINLDLASADYFDGRASLWTALEMRSSVSDERPTAILGFDETFLRPFARALIEAATTRAAYRMTILQEARASERCRVVEYVTGPGKALEELMLQPFDNVVLISAAREKTATKRSSSCLVPTLFCAPLPKWLMLPTKRYTICSRIWSGWLASANRTTRRSARGV